MYISKRNTGRSSNQRLRPAYFSAMMTLHQLLSWRNSLDLPLFIAPTGTITMKTFPQHKSWEQLPTYDHEDDDALVPWLGPGDYGRDNLREESSILPLPQQEDPPRRMAHQDSSQVQTSLRSDNSHPPIAPAARAVRKSARAWCPSEKAL